MEIVKIPKVSFWNTERLVFHNLEKFINLVDRLCRGSHPKGNKSAPIVVLRELATVNKYPIGQLNELFRDLRDAAFAYRPPEHKLSQSDVSPLFNDEALIRWGNLKNKLKKFIKLHGQSMDTLHTLQEDCWWSRDKMKQYAIMLQAAERSVGYYRDQENEYRLRMLAIKRLKKDLLKKQNKHMKNVTKFQEKLTVEQELRRQIKQVAGTLEFEIVNCVKEKLDETWNKLQQFTTGYTRLERSDMERISKQLYEITCRNYTFQCPPADISGQEFNIPLTRPTIEANHFEFCDHNSTYASHTYTAPVLDDSGEKDDFYLPLKKGDNVKVKIVSSEMTVGFGWTRKSTFHQKKWGFFNCKNIKLYPVDD